MHFLIDACLPRDFATVVSSYGHVAVDVRDIGMKHAADPDIADYAADILPVLPGRLAIVRLTRIRLRPPL